MRGRSYSPRGYGRRGRSPSPRGGGRGRSRDDPTTLLVRNLRHDCRPEDLKKPFDQIGPVKDIYLPRDYYTREPRGFGFIQYLDAADAAEAKYRMDGQVFQGRQLTVVFAEENRKKPQEMRARERGSGRGGRNHDRRGTPPRYHNSPRYSRSPPPRSRDYYTPPKRRQYSRSVSPEEKRYSRERSYSPRGGQGRSYSQSPPREQSPPFNGSRRHSQSSVRVQSPPCNGSRSRSRSPAKARSSPVRSHSRRRSPSQSHSRSPDAVPYSRNPDCDLSPRH